MLCTISGHRPIAPELRGAMPPYYWRYQAFPIRSLLVPQPCWLVSYPWRNMDFRVFEFLGYLTHISGTESFDGIVLWASERVPLTLPIDLSFTPIRPVFVVQRLPPHTPSSSSPGHFRAFTSLQTSKYLPFLYPNTLPPSFDLSLSGLKENSSGYRPIHDFRDFECFIHI